MADEHEIRMTRKELYDEIWAMSAVKVSKKYNVPYGKLLGICKENNIPVPPSGYWTQISFGKTVSIAALVGEEGLIIVLPKEVSKKNLQVVKVEIESPTTIVIDDSSPIKQIESMDKANILENFDAQLLFLTEEERIKVLIVANNLSSLGGKTSLHSKITEYKKIIKEWNDKDIKYEFAQRSLSNFSKKPPFLAGTLSKKTLPRVFILLDRLYRQVEKLGGAVNQDLSLQIRGERVPFDIVEAQDKAEHILSKKEAKEVAEYENRNWRKPNIRKYDYFFNGKIKIIISNSEYFRDSGYGKVEDMLDKILIAVYKKSEDVRIERLKKEEEELKRQEAQRLKEQRERLHDIEVEKTWALENEALDYERACRIRCYIAAIEGDRKYELTEEVHQWVKWAKGKADWFDPITAKEDEVFGVREHSKDEDQKKLKRYRYWW
jgi:hypothetical protein